MVSSTIIRQAQHLRSNMLALVFTNKIVNIKESDTMPLLKINNSLSEFD